MSQEQQQLRFSVEESVWFQKGQEVSELISISLDPDISIHEHDQYISVRGALQLTGEYKIDEQVEILEEDLHYANVRYVNDVSTNEDGVSHIKHRFPVDITIPRNRIQSLEEVYVTIESFDYELPERKCLKLIADLSISGIGADNVQVTAAVYDQEEQFEALYRGPQATVYEDEIAEQEQNEVEEVEALEEIEVEDVEVSSSREFDTVTEVNQEEDSSDEEEHETESFAQNLFANNIEDQDDNSENLHDSFEVEVRKNPQEIEGKNVYQKPEVQYSLFSAAEKPPEVKQSSSNRSQQKEVQLEEQGEESHYLKSLFAREEEDDDFSKLKMCIVQQGETIDTICQRYDLTIQQIMRVNDFGVKQDVAEGQILYIPVYANSK